MSNMSNLIVVDKTSTAEDKFQYSYNLEEIGGRILITDLFQSKYDEKSSERCFEQHPKKSMEA